MLGLYGLTVKRDPPDDYGALPPFSGMEIAVFFLEDGAAILLLAKSTSEMDVLPSRPTSW